MASAEAIALFSIGLIVGMCVIGAPWCFWYARLLRRLCEAEEFTALEIAMDKEA